MKRLLVIDLKNYDPSLPVFRRPSVRGVILREGLVAMIHSLKFDYYKFPGGGLEEGESHVQTLIREVREETGLTVLPESVREFGSVLRVQKSLYDEKIFEQENFYYFCDISADTGTQHLDAYEADEGFTLEFVSPEHAIEVNRTHDHGGYDDVLIEREALVLELLKEVL